MTSWKPKVAGIAGLLGAVLLELQYLLDDDPTTIFDANVLLTAFLAVGLFFTRQNNVTSETAIGIKGVAEQKKEEVKAEK